MIIAKEYSRNIKKGEYFIYIIIKSKKCKSFYKKINTSKRVTNEWLRDHLKQY